MGSEVPSDVICNLYVCALTGSVQLPGVPHCRVLTHPDCLYTWDPWLLSEKPGHRTVPSPQRPAKPDCSEGEKPVDIFLS